METIKSHSLNLSGETISVTGVKEVLTFENNIIVLDLNDKTLTIKGENLKVSELNVKDGRFFAAGSVIGIMYSKGREKLSFMKKIFK